MDKKTKELLKQTFYLALLMAVILQVYKYGYENGKVECVVAPTFYDIPFKDYVTGDGTKVE